MPDKKTYDESQSYDVNGHKISYRKADELEQLLIDGRPVAFFRVGDKYCLEQAAYESSRASLPHAARSFARRLCGLASG